MAPTAKKNTGFFLGAIAGAAGVEPAVAMAGVGLR